MANKKVKYSDIAEKNLFQEGIDSAKAFLKILEEIEKQFKATIKVSSEASKNNPIKSYDDAKKAEKDINDVQKAVKGLTEVEKQRVKLQQKLIDVQSEQAKQNAVLREDIRIINRENKRAAVQASELTTEYEKQSARLNTLRREYKDLAAQNKSNTKEAKALLKEITELDSQLKEIDKTVGQNQRNVGNYEAAVNKLRGSFKALSTVAVIGVLTSIADLFKGSETGADLFRKGLARVTITLTVFISTIVKAVQESEGFLDFFDKAQKGFEGFTDRIEEAIKAQDNIIDKTREYNRDIAQLEVNLAKLQKTQARLTIISDDNTLSLKQQLDANKELLEVSINVANEQLKIAKKREEIAKRERDNSKLISETGKASVETEQAFAAAQVERVTAETELQNVRIENAKRNREIIRDAADLELDILIDAFDNQKTINERIIADETQTLDKRRMLLELTEKEFEDSFNNQIAIIQKLTKERIDANSLIQESDSVVLNERIKLLGLDEITQTRLLEVIRDRKTAIQDLKEANKELTASEREGRDLQSDLSIQDKLIEKLANIQDLKKEGLELEEILSDFEGERLQNDIDNLQAKIALIEFEKQVRIDSLKKQLEDENLTAEQRKKIENEILAEQKSVSKQRLEAQKELNEKLIEQQLERLNKEKELDKKALEQRVELTKAATDGINQLFQKQSEQQLDSIDRQIEASKKREEELRELAQDNVQEATESLSTEQRKQAELERDRERTIKRRQRLEFALSAIQTYSNKVAAGEENALGSTITDLSVLRAFVDSLPTFFTGSEMIGDDLQESSLLKGESKDKHLIRVDGSERILTGEQNKLIGNMSNLELATLAHAHNTGNLVNNVNVIDLSSVNRQLKEVKNAIENKPVLRDINYDAINHAIAETVERKGRRERNIKRVKNIF
jgi:hypothetical protein